MRILHTADWHIGRSLYNRKRYEEFDAFLKWLSETIHNEKIDVLLVAGDVFDTCTPTNYAQQIYYNFLYSLTRTCCRHVVVIAGNHDSPTFLEAPKELLRHLDIHVVGAISTNLEDEVIVLHNQGNPELIVCAVPYLRDRDIRLVDENESLVDKERKLLDGIKQHYSAVCDLAKTKKEQLASKNIPLIAMGHLFTQGGKTTEGDGVRDLYAGNLAHVHADIFPDYIDYTALGHLHVPQKVGKRENVRYSGSPIPMGFGEAQQQKCVNIIDFSTENPQIADLAIPRFQHLHRIQGNWETISEKINHLKAEQSKAWLEVIYDSTEVIGNLQSRMEELLDGSPMEVLRCNHIETYQRTLTGGKSNETLDDLTPHEVFERCLEKNKVDESQRSDLRLAYNEILLSIQQEDTKAE